MIWSAVILNQSRVWSSVNKEVPFGELLQITHTQEDLCVCWEAFLENILGEDKVRAQYFRMEKQAQMPPVAKQVRDLYIWSCPFRLLFVFLLDRIMDTGKYFSSVGEVAGMSVMINGKWPTAEQCRQREERRWLWPESYQLHPVVAMCQQGPNLPIFPQNPEIQKLIRT